MQYLGCSGGDFVTLTDPSQVQCTGQIVSVMSPDLSGLTSEQYASLGEAFALGFSLVVLSAAVGFGARAILGFLR